MTSNCPDGNPVCSLARDFPELFPVRPGPCPQCKSPYLLELSDKEGTWLVCPNNQDRLPKRRAKRGAEEDKATGPVCHFEEKIGPPKPSPEPKEISRPDPANTRPVVEAVA